MGSDTEKTPVKSDEDEKPIGSLFKFRKSRGSYRKKKAQFSQIGVEENCSKEEDLVSSGEINDTLASIKKKLKRPKSCVKQIHVPDQELQSAEISKSSNKRPRIDLKLAGSDDMGLQDSLSVLFKRARKVKNQGSEKLAETISDRIAVESAEEPQEVSVPTSKQETETKPSLKEEEEETFHEIAKEGHGLEVGLSHCSAEPTVEKCDLSKESICGVNLVSEMQEKEKSERFPVKEHLEEEVQELSREEEISKENVVSEMHEKENVEGSSVKERLEEEVQVLSREEEISKENVVCETHEKENVEGSSVKEHLEEVRELSREEEISKEKVVSEMHEKENVEGSSVKEHLEEIEELSREEISKENVVSEMHEKENVEGSSVKEHLEEEVQELYKEEISKENVVSEMHEKENVEGSSVKECLEDIRELPREEEISKENVVSEMHEKENVEGSSVKEVVEMNPVSERLEKENIDCTCSPREKVTKLEEETLYISTEKQIPGTPDSTRAEADDMSPKHNEATTNEPAAFNARETQTRARNAKKRRHDDMAYEGDAEWEVVVVNEQGLFNNLPVDQPDESFNKPRDTCLLIEEEEEEANYGYVAAVAAGLKARALTPIEKLKFKELLRRKGGLHEYLECRNMILSRWRKDVRHILPLSSCGVSDNPLQDASPRELLIREIYLFLNQNGYINTGIAFEKEAYKCEVKPALPHFEDIKELKLDESNGFKPTSPERKLELPGDATVDGYQISAEKDSTINQKRIIIIGAGPSGLAAARHLNRQGFSVTVLEARDRIGGRVHTDRASLSVPVDLGASIITGVEADLATERQPDPSSLICSQLGLELTVLNSDCPLYDLATGEKVPSELDEALEAEYNTLHDEMMLLVAHHGEKLAQLSLEHGLEYGLRKHRQSGIECGDGLDEICKERDGTDDVLTPMERRVMNWHFAHLEYGCATMLKEVSLPHWNQDDAYGGFGGAHCMIKGGFSAVIESLANGLDVRLSHAVTEVDYGDGKKVVRICTSNGGTFEGDAVLVTVPLGCLKADSIKFSPELPDWKKMSIKRLGFGVLNKVILEFPTVFWDETVDYFGATAEETDLRGRCFMFWNVKKTCDAPVLIALVVGKAAIDGQSINPSDHVAHAMMVLRRIFSQVSVPDPLGSVVTNWGSEPFTRGSYSYVAVGASGEDYDILGRPVSNCLFFAGEATCKEHPDTVGGAMLSGVREAVRIADLLRVGRDFVAEIEAMETTSKNANKRSDRARNEVRDVSRRLEACDLSSAMYPSVSKEALLREMFFNAKTTSGRLHLVKELLRLPVDALRSFAGSKDGLGTLNSWILDSLGKNSTQLLRHCVRLLVIVSTDLVAVRLSGIGRTVKEKVCVHTSRDIRAIASQLVRVWIEIFRKEKASNGGLRLLKQTKGGIMQISKSNKKPEGRAILRSEAMLDAKSEASSLHSQRTVHAVESEAEPNPIIMSEEEAAAFAAAEAARAAAIAAAQAYASAEAEKAALELPKIPSFHKFANRLHTEESDPRRRLLLSGGEVVATCQNQNLPDTSRISSNSYACPTIREDSIECSSVPENRSIFTKAWVDVDAVRVDGVKDACAIERWQDQAFESDSEFYTRLCIPEREELTPVVVEASGTSHKLCSPASQAAEEESKKNNSEGRSHGVERVKQGILDYVATLLKPLYKTNKLDRDGYKAIMKKTVTKVLEQLTEAEKAMSAFEFLNFKRKSKIRALVDKLIERQMQTKGANDS